MSARFKRPKPILNMGDQTARMIKYARTIKTPQQLKDILGQVSPQVAAGFLELVKGHLPFKVDDLSNLDKLQSLDLQLPDKSA